MGPRVPGLVAAVLLALTMPAPAAAEGIELSGYVAGEARLFPYSPAAAKQNGAAVHLSLAARPELTREWNGGDDRLTAVPFLRLDSADPERTHADVREFNWLHVGSDWDLRIGLDRVFWGVAESRHLIDIVNQTDGIEGIDGEDKLGQPMINLGLQRDWGDVNVLILPGFRERTFAGARGRFRGSPPVDTGQAFYVGDAGRGNVGLALRYTAVVGDFDIGLSHFHGTGREPRLVPGTTPTGGAAYIPHYDIIDQTGLDVQATLGDWLWKLEAMARSGQGDAFGAVVGGFEYTLYGVLGSAADVGLLAEYLHDGRDASAPATSMDDDLFLGARITLNDVAGTDFLGGIVIDRKSGGSLVSLEADRRLSDHWTVEAEARAFVGLAATDPGRGLGRDHYFQVRLVRYF